MTKRTRKPPPAPERFAEFVRFDRVRPDPDNARRHPKANLLALKAALLRYGQRKPVVGNRRTGLLEAGNATWQVLLEIWNDATVRAQAIEVLKRPGLWVRWEDDDEVTARGYAIADNRTAELAEWDPAPLVLSLQALRTAGELPVVGFDDADLREQLERLNAGDGFQPSAAIMVAPELAAKIEPGQVWILARHRLACGDARSPELFARLMASGTAQCVWTDPPYGVSYQEDAIAGDDLRRDDLLDLVQRALRNALGHSTASAAFYVWHASSTREDYAAALKAVGLEERQYLIWAKPSLTLGRADYQWAHEPCFYAGRASQAIAFYGHRDQTTVWRFATRADDGSAVVLGPGLVLTDGAGHEVYLAPKTPKGKRVRHLRVTPETPARIIGEEPDSTLWDVAREHAPADPTQKPIELARRAVENSSRQGDVVLDPFAGSGTLLMAAEATGRAARLIELEPKWCALAIARWEAMTGQNAQLEERTTLPDGEPSIPAGRRAARRASRARG